MAKKSEKFSKSKTLGTSVFTFILGAIIGVVGSVAFNMLNVNSDEKANDNIVGEIYDEFQVHFLELGNIYAGDSIYVKAGDVDILIDAGSRTSSKDTIKSYVNQYCKDGKLEYVIATHAHQDHIAAFACDGGIFSSYEIDTLIDFPLTNSTSDTYKTYVEGKENLIKNGTNYYSALDCVNNKNGAQAVYNLSTNITMEILYNDYYEQTTSNENDYSVCVLFNSGSNKFLLTGDLEEKGEKALAQNAKEKIKDCDVFKAGHHGSYTASSDALLEVIKPKVSVCTCVCGSTEYTKNNANTFPSQNYIDRISKYTSQVYVTSLCNDYQKGEYTSMNGNVIVSSNLSNIAVSATNNTTLLKDTEWFKNNRTCPENWK